MGNSPIEFPLLHVNQNYKTEYSPLSSIILQSGVEAKFHNKGIKNSATQISNEIKKVSAILIANLNPEVYGFQIEKLKELIVPFGIFNMYEFAFKKPSQDLQKAFFEILKDLNAHDLNYGISFNQSTLALINLYREVECVKLIENTDEQSKALVNLCKRLICYNHFLKAAEITISIQNEEERFAGLIILLTDLTYTSESFDKQPVLCKLLEIYQTVARQEYKEKFLDQFSELNINCFEMSLNFLQKNATQKHIDAVYFQMSIKLSEDKEIEESVSFAGKIEDKAKRIEAYNYISQKAKICGNDHDFLFKTVFEMERKRISLVYTLDLLKMHISTGDFQETVKEAARLLHIGFQTPETQNRKWNLFNDVFRLLLEVKKSDCLLVYAFKNFQPDAKDSIANLKVILNGFDHYLRLLAKKGRYEEANTIVQSLPEEINSIFAPK